ncbi:TraR/DksA C4-type zinc finger protein [Phenylobacterium sp.]|uniref:TraR/DksA family transcriptional regulator n=1 Tax=Phenylobacterium sp. TaxID=1871053 RepID=UPI00272F93BB|nr:TraR/DksA C4-type zinc finger protein [Phenylobacterium sp.]MDP1617327.1 TraR/DksA C4-type zinc finger protein [Phenylobacterium sp.]MDP1985699.1 TraR/DksA C4-type zinc finger protein [Phenylobacterium sp.]
MSDDADRAQALEEFGRDVALRRVLGDAPFARPVSGFCEDCDDTVEAERLTANPTARRCLFCQEAHERRRRACVRA